MNLGVNLIAVLGFMLLYGVEASGPGCCCRACSSS